MPNLEDLNEQYPRADQEVKRKIGRYCYNRPARWVSRNEFVEMFDIDGSGVSRHLNSLHDDGFLISMRKNGQRFVQWGGRGAGGFGYNLRQMLPSQLWSAGSELRPLLSVNHLGGAYLPTFLFGFLVLFSFIAAVFSIIISNLTSNSLLGITVQEAVIWTGLMTILATTVLLLLPLAKLAGDLFGKAWELGTKAAKKDEKKENDRTT